MSRGWKIIIGVLIVVLCGLVVLYKVFDKPLPKGTAGTEADELAHLMLDALNHEAYNSLNTISWTYMGDHHYMWDKKVDSVSVRWGEKYARFSTQSLHGVAMEKGIQLTGVEAQEVIDRAWVLFANDSFWLVAPFKVNDPGTVRSVVEVDRRKCLLVTYTSGGVTPGDSYLWMLDNQYRPVAWKFWVKIIPIGGVSFTWDDWKEYQGVWFSTRHEGLKDIQITNLQVN